MKRTFFLVVLLLILVVSCTPSKDELIKDNPKKIQEKYETILKDYAKLNYKDISNYNLLYLKVIPTYGIDSLVEIYDDRLEKILDCCDSLMDDKKSVFYDWMHINRPNIHRMCFEISYAYDEGKKFTDTDLLLSKELCDLYDEAIKKLDTSAENIKHYTGVWVYNCDKNGYKQVIKCNVTLPRLDEFNMDMINVVEFEKEDYEISLDELKSSMEYANCMVEILDYTDVDNLLYGQTEYYISKIKDILKEYHFVN